MLPLSNLLNLKDRLNKIESQITEITSQTGNNNPKRQISMDDRIEHLMNINNKSGKCSITNFIQI